MKRLPIIFLLFTATGSPAQKLKKTALRDEPINPSETPICYHPVEPSAHFGAGAHGFRKFLEKNLRIDSLMRQQAPKGCQTVQIRFIVQKDGRLTDITVENDSLVHAVYAAEALRVIRLSPRWKPAIQGGSPVKSYHQQPITFCAEAEEADSTAPAVPAIADTVFAPAVFHEGSAAMQAWFRNQLEQIPVQTMLPGTISCYNAGVHIRFQLHNNIADHIVLIHTDIPAAIQKEIIRLIQTPGIWKPVLPTTAVPAAAVIVYSASIQIALDERLAGGFSGCKH